MFCHLRDDVLVSTYFSGQWYKYIVYPSIQTTKIIYYISMLKYCIMDNALRPVALYY